MRNGFVNPLFDGVTFVAEASSEDGFEKTGVTWVSYVSCVGDDNGRVIRDADNDRLSDVWPSREGMVGTETTGSMEFDWNNLVDCPCVRQVVGNVGTVVRRCCLVCLVKEGDLLTLVLCVDVARLFPVFEMNSPFAYTVVGLGLGSREADLNDA
jgi:hypothetical protein